MHPPPVLCSSLVWRVGKVGNTVGQSLRHRALNARVVTLRWFGGVGKARGGKGSDPESFLTLRIPQADGSRRVSDKSILIPDPGI